jgi:hypothetical protein
MVGVMVRMASGTGVGLCESIAVGTSKVNGCCGGIAVGTGWTYGWCDGM